MAVTTEGREEGSILVSATAGAHADRASNRQVGRRAGLCALDPACTILQLLSLSLLCTPGPSSPRSQVANFWLGLRLEHEGGGCLRGLFPLCPALLLTFPPTGSIWSGRCLQDCPSQWALGANPPSPCPSALEVIMAFSSLISAVHHPWLALFLLPHDSQ